MQENVVSMHKNENVTLEISWDDFIAPEIFMENWWCTISSMEFSFMKILGTTFSFSCMEISFSCMKASCQDFHLHKTFRTGTVVHTSTWNSMHSKALATCLQWHARTMHTFLYNRSCVYCVLVLQVMCRIMTGKNFEYPPYYCVACYAWETRWYLEKCSASFPKLLQVHLEEIYNVRKLCAQLASAKYKKYKKRRPLLPFVLVS